MSITVDPISSKSGNSSIQYPYGPLQGPPTFLFSFGFVENSLVLRSRLSYG